MSTEKTWFDWENDAYQARKASVVSFIAVFGALFFDVLDWRFPTTAWWIALLIWAITRTYAVYCARMRDILYEQARGQIAMDYVNRVGRRWR